MNQLTRTGTEKRVSLLSIAILGAIFAACTPTAAGEQDKNWTDLESLVETSDRIITATFIDSSLQTIQLIDSGTGAISGETEVLFRQFEVFETFKGTSDQGDLLWVAFEPGKTGELFDGQGNVQGFRADQAYVLFLKGRLRPLEYPPEFGAILWTGNGEPSFAQVLGERLQFRAESAFLQLLKADGTSLPDPLSAAPFEATIADVRSAAK